MTEGGEVVFVERGRIKRPLILPCGQCIGCRLERSRQWAIRCVHESQMHEFNSFVTLTYSDENLPTLGSLFYRDFQLFMKRLRKRLAAAGRQRESRSLPGGEVPRVRFYMCGEYGEKLGRPHYHACLFGVWFDDREYWRKSPSGALLYRSALLEELWPHGTAEIGDVTFESAAYVARYIMKKVIGKHALEHYSVCNEDGEIIGHLEPEFTSMSLKPGIGAGWFKKFHQDVFPHDYVVINGMKVKPPKYYDKIVKGLDPYFAEELGFEREKKSEVYLGDTTPERLEVRRRVTEARLSFKVRTLE